MNNHTFITSDGSSYYYDGQNLNPQYDETDHAGSHPGNLNGVQASDFHVIKLIIGRVGVPGCDFNFAAAADHLVQNLDLGSIIPAKAKVKDIQVICIESVVGVTDFAVNVGNVSGGSQFIGSVSCNVINEVVGSTATTVINWVAATNIWLGGDPTDNTWNLMTAGKWEVCITYQQFN